MRYLLQSKTEQLNAAFQRWPKWLRVVCILVPVVATGVVYAYVMLEIVAYFGLVMLDDVRNASVGLLLLIIGGVTAIMMNHWLNTLTAIRYSLVSRVELKKRSFRLRFFSIIAFVGLTVSSSVFMGFGMGFLMRWAVPWIIGTFAHH